MSGRLCLESAYEIFMRQLPQDELANWAEWTSEALLANKKKPTGAKEMGLFLGCMIAQTRSSKVGGVGRSFATLSDGLFPPQDLGRFGMGHKRYKEIYSNWQVAKEIKEGPKKTDTSDFYWPTDQLIDRFNEHYKKNFIHGRDVNVDERMWWFYGNAHAEAIASGVHKVGRKPKDTGPEMNCLSACDVSVTTTFEHVRDPKRNAERMYAKEYGGLQPQSCVFASRLEFRVRDEESRLTPGSPTCHYFVYYGATAYICSE